MTDRRENTFKLTGRLTVDEVPSVYREHLNWKDNGVPASIDLSSIELSDSSAVALLLEWLSWARQAGDKVRFENPPENLQTLAGLSQADRLLGWRDE